jgi:hypothetical protein
MKINSSSNLSLKEQGKTCSFYLVARFGPKRAKLPVYHTLKLLSSKNL